MRKKGKLRSDRRRKTKFKIVRLGNYKIQPCKTTDSCIRVSLKKSNALW